jgi:hypothetical protein
MLCEANALLRNGDPPRNPWPGYDALPEGSSARESKLEEVLDQGMNIETPAFSKIGSAIGARRT